ncbi:MAG: LytTR family transcriptional regulator DNA-binding domain-containing protein [Lachnospiraceae bacterium]|nr:LytTR family transcriptional regulator DNA-binding domain-containing protein [Lachnospiraceae bacterium]MBR5355724.1 LytTR family transcriptional regulator DNA-binding domain-containing protein [Lachnospiraceae bacterium]
MKITILTPGPGEEDEIIVKMKDLSSETLSLIKRLKDGEQKEAIAAYSNDNIVMLSLNDIYYFDAVDNKVFSYTKDKCFEVKKKLFEIEEEFEQTSFVRISKNAIVNIKKIERLVPEFNGRFEAKLKNGESIIISRGYVPLLKRKLGVGK